MKFLQNFYFETLELASLCLMMFAFPYFNSKQIHHLGPCVGIVLLFFLKHYLTSPKEMALCIALGQDAAIVHNLIKRMLYIILICFPKRVWS